MDIIANELYSSFKAAHHLQKLQDLRDGKIILPVQIQVDLTNLCNHACRFCFYRGVNRNIVTNFNVKDVLPQKVAENLALEIDLLGIPAIQITGGGEPLMCSYIKEYLDFLNNNTKLELALVTNGVLLTDEIIDKMYRFSWIRVSIDAATQETYIESQGGNYHDFDRVVNNVEKLVKRLVNTVIGVSFVVNPINYKEIVKATILYKKLGVHNVRFSIAYTEEQTKIFIPIMDEIIALSREARTYSDDNFRVFDLSYDHMVQLEAKKVYKICGYSHFTAAIEANGIVRPCCTMKGLSHSNFGNIKEQSFKDIWFGEKRKKWLERFDASKCLLCWMDQKNLFIEYLIKKKPLHVNFV